MARDGIESKWNNISSLAIDDRKSVSLTNCLLFIFAILPTRPKKHLVASIGVSWKWPTPRSLSVDAYR
jgi:hypothetical protein